jgi:hypothetical protein
LLFLPAARVSFAASDALKTYMFFSFSSLQSGKGREASEGTSELIFFRPFFVQRQRKDINAIRERAQQCERTATQLQKV